MILPFSAIVLINREHRQAKAVTGSFCACRPPRTLSLRPRTPRITIFVLVEGASVEEQVLPLKKTSVDSHLQIALAHQTHQQIEQNITRKAVSQARERIRIVVTNDIETNSGEEIDPQRRPGNRLLQCPVHVVV